MAYKPITHPKVNSPLFAVAPLPTLDGLADRQARGSIEWVWNEYGGLGGVRLSELTHETGTPWRTIAIKNNFEVPLNTEIPETDDWTYFASLAKDRGFQPEPIRNQS